MNTASKKIVISQPMFFPWVGLFEQIRLSDVYVHYDDVQFPQGRSFMSRVQIKTPAGIQWLTVPVKREEKQSIKNVMIDDCQRWREKHLKTLQFNYAKALFVDEMLSLVESIYSQDTLLLSELNIVAIEKIAEYFDIKRSFLRSSDYSIQSSSSEKLLQLILHLNGTVYITGHGARNYLDHELFESNGIRVEYMDYQRTPYAQLHGDFNPHVSILDLIANVGCAGVEFIHSPTKYWRDFINESGK